MSYEETRPLHLAANLRDAEPGSVTLSINSQNLRQRRRRVTLDQNQASGDGDAVADTGHRVSDASRTPATRPYSAGARRSSQFKTTDLIPKRRWTVAAFLLFLLLMIAALNGTHYSVPSLQKAVGDSVLDAFSLDSGRGLNSWYCNFLLILTSFASAQIYLLRQHRRDDYRGSYRVWLWLAAICLTGSMVSVTAIPDVISKWLPAASAGGAGLPWLRIIQLLGLTLFCVRGLLEVRNSRLAVAGLSVVWAGFAGAILLQDMPGVQAVIAAKIQAVQGNLLLLATSSMLFAVVSFARYVCLEANGLIRRPDTLEKAASQQHRQAARETKTGEPHVTRTEKAARKRPSRTGTGRDETGSGRNVAGGPSEMQDCTTSEPLTKSRSLAGPVKNGATASGTVSAHSARSADDSSSGLSKSELRRMRKRQRKAA